jgi:hypothetical protein
MSASDRYGLGRKLQAHRRPGQAASAIEAIGSRARVATRDVYVLFGNNARLLLAADERIVT